MNKTLLHALVCVLPILGTQGAAMTLSYSDVNPAGIVDTFINGVPGRLIRVADEELLLQAGSSLTIQVGFLGGRSLLVAPAIDPPGTELINLALVSPSVNGTPPNSNLAGTVSVTALGDFNPGSDIAVPFVQNFVADSPLAGADTILLIQSGNLTDTGYALMGLEYQLTVPAGFADYPLTGINLLVTGGAFSVVPLPAGIVLLLSAVVGAGALRRAQLRGQ